MQLLWRPSSIAAISSEAGKPGAAAAEGASAASLPPAPRYLSICPASSGEGRALPLRRLLTCEGLT